MFAPFFAPFLNLDEKTQRFIPQVLKQVVNLSCYNLKKVLKVTQNIIFMQLKKILRTLFEY